MDIAHELEAARREIDTLRAKLPELETAREALKSARTILAAVKAGGACGLDGVIAEVETALAGKTVPRRKQCSHDYPNREQGIGWCKACQGQVDACGWVHPA